MSGQGSHPARFNRREALGMLGAGAGLGLFAGGREAVAVTSAQTAASGATQVGFSQGAIIRTIIKDVSPNALGTGATLFHEHLSTAARTFTNDAELMLEEVRAAGKDGVACIVDGGHEDMGRHVQHLRTIGARSGVHIVASGGFYIQPRYPTGVARQTEDELVEELLRDAAAERWGALGEIGSSMEMHALERKVFRAIGRVTLRTGLPIFTHIPRDCGRCGVEQFDILESLNVDPRKICIGHIANQTDDPQANMAKAIAKRGAFLGFDTMRPPPEHMERAVRMILSVVEAGYEDHVLLSHDGLDEKLLKRNGGPGYSMVLTMFVPQLRKVGVPETTVRKFLVDNPRRFLAFVPTASS